MIVKIKSWKRPQFRKLLDYMIYDKDRLTGKDGRGFLLVHNLKGKTINGWVQQLEENEKFRLHKRKNSVYITHEILSWHKDDAPQITPEKLEAMTREYMRLRGSGAFVAVPHYDKEHYHVHILASGIEYRTGKAMRLSRAELATLKKNIQQYQVERFPELVHSVVQHGRKQKTLISEKEYQMQSRTGKTTKREEVRVIVQSCYEQSSSQDDFYARLEACKLSIYWRGGKIYGVVSAGRRYRFKKWGIEPLPIYMNVSSRQLKAKRIRQYQSNKKWER